MFGNYTRCPLVPLKTGGYVILKSRESAGPWYDRNAGVFSQSGTGEEFVKIGTWFGKEKNGLAHGTGLLLLVQRDCNVIAQFDKGMLHGVSCGCHKRYGSCNVFFRQNFLGALERCAFSKFRGLFATKSVRDWVPDVDISRMENKPLKWLALTRLPKCHIGVALGQKHLGDNWIPKRHHIRVFSTLS